MKRPSHKGRFTLAVAGSGKTPSLLLHTLKRYLEDPGKHDRRTPTSDARRVILDAPHPVRRVIWAWKEDQMAKLSDLPSKWVDHIIATYSSPDFQWGEAWAASTWETERHVIDLILSLPNPRHGTPLEELLEQVAVPKDNRSALLFETARHVHSSAEQGPPCVSQP